MPMVRDSKVQTFIFAKAVATWKKDTKCNKILLPCPD